MLKFILRKLAYGYLVLFGVFVMVFSFFHVLPGDPLNLILGKHGGNKELRAIVAKSYGLDQPLYKQFVYYLNDFSFISFHEDTPENKKKYEYSEIASFGESVMVLKSPYLRRSYYTYKRVDEIVWGSLEGTFWLASSAMVLATVFGIALGVLAALGYNTFWDRFLITTSTLGISAPSFVSAILMSMIFGFYLGDWTGLPPQGYMWKLDPLNGGRVLALEHLVLPCITLGIRPMAIIVQLTRSSMLEVLSKDYIRTARAKGLGKASVIAKHALKNALNPVVTAISGWLASLMAGAFFVERIFNWKGIGWETINAVENLDMPIIMAMTLVVAVIFVIVNILVDLLYAALDPRVELK